MNASALGEFITVASTRYAGVSLTSSIASAWNTRRLNTITSGSKTWFDLDMGYNFFTLSGPASYMVWASAPASGVNGHQIRIWNNSTDSLVATGTSEYAATSAQSFSKLSAVIAVPVGGHLFRFEHYTAVSGLLGLAVGAPGSKEVYAMLEIVKLDANAVSALVPSELKYASLYPYLSVTLSTAPVTPPSNGVATLFAMDTINAASQMSFTTSSTPIFITVTGLYMVSAFVQITSTTTSVVTLDAWVRQNGVDIPKSGNTGDNHHQWRRQVGGDRGHSIPQCRRVLGAGVDDIVGQCSFVCGDNLRTSTAGRARDGFHARALPNGNISSRGI